MPDIVTLTVNPAIDLSTSVERLTDTHKMRCAPARCDPGGGGINVARVIHRLGGDCLALYLAGGPVAAILARLLAAEGLVFEAMPIAGETRENFSIKEASTGREFRFVMPGPSVSAAEWRACLDRLEALQPPPRYLVLSGSLPLGVPDDFYARVIRAAKARGCRVVLDGSGQALRLALPHAPYLIKPSLHELRGLTGLALKTEAAWEQAARRIVADGHAQVVALSLGAGGAMLVTRDGVVRAGAVATPVREHHWRGRQLCRRHGVGAQPQRGRARGVWLRCGRRDGRARARRHRAGQPCRDRAVPSQSPAVMTRWLDAGPP